jgi:hypothetical protein
MIADMQDMAWDVWKIVGGAVWLIGMFLAIYLSITKLRRRYSSFVYTIWYLFSLTFCSTLLVAWW